jgi:molybdopterin/thiamine biosynthesis adenylyltransferase
MKKLLIVGAGGIGSWLTSHLYELDRHSQLGGLSITVADDDTVDSKNLSYQNYGTEDITDYKVESLAARYGINGLVKKVVDKSDLDNYDCIISAVDNTSFRKLLFKEASNTQIYWIDLRSEGTSVAAFSKHKKNTVPRMLDTIPKEQENQSCQRAFELESGIVQNGNKIVAAIGAQYILNWLRGEINPPVFSAKF